MATTDTTTTLNQKDNSNPEIPNPANPGNTGDTDTGKKKCDYLFPPEYKKNQLPFVPFIPTVIAIALFVYGWVTTTKTSGGPDPITTLKGCYIIYIIGFFIVFMQAFTNMFNTKWWEYYNGMIQSKSGAQKIFWTIKTVLVTCIEPLRSNIKIFGGIIPVGLVQYFNYPLNYLIYASVMIAICVAFLGWILMFEKCNGEDNPKNNMFNTYNVMKSFSGETDYGSFNLLLGGLSIVGILFSILTNGFIMEGLDPDTEKYYKFIGKKPLKWGGKHSENICWILRIVKWSIGLFSMIILGYWYSEWSSSVKKPEC